MGQAAPSGLSWADRSCRAALSGLQGILTPDATSLWPCSPFPELPQLSRIWVGKEKSSSSLFIAVRLCGQLFVAGVRWWLLEVSPVQLRRCFHLNISKSYFPVVLREPRPRLPREVVEAPARVTFKTHLDMFLWPLIDMNLLWQGGPELIISQGPLQPSPLCDAVNSFAAHPQPARAKAGPRPSTAPSPAPLLSSNPAPRCRPTHFRSTAASVTAARSESRGSARKPRSVPCFPLQQRRAAPRLPLAEQVPLVQAAALSVAPGSVMSQLPILWWGPRWGVKSNPLRGPRRKGGGLQLGRNKPSISPGWG
ncbi:uncharacterized protein LOC133627970 [Colius striatus]|uniref:uncharacterized protein LOC133627970 n=1 Tax=Colius striatus TaxID=57412 RepID=UPI002B1D132A|nr:uncharacterized protein LOC133627970 [Colius striatus]XP_061871591.1 uncharacterized protein LOC133627970 [Colius striatus]XP_061871592.1 uncharacterized protein LOC133627970 [Colius striatus]XP_061871593.1 uncharacterized protein LOC133627970 [Colius striatus]XP_061871595.1 uncharacterized protein LOC133627970 [Colius striatus]XP_061871596.1 uncharacterized protein LOC133627970 [Colius striatus]XP_061871597.1 uncharacterized protein LOC133627970 [Colius striatus]XP_061871598.1 uncharacte